MNRWRVLYWMSMAMLGASPLVPIAVVPPMLGVATVLNLFANWPKIKSHPSPFLRRAVGAVNRDVTAMEFFYLVGSFGLIIMVTLGFVIYVI